MRIHQPLANSKLSYFCLQMKILLTGNFDPSYNRNEILIKGLRALSDLELRMRPFSEGKPSKKDFDWANVVFLPAFTHADVKWVKKQSDKPLVFDPLISKYLTKVFDYKQVHRWSPRAAKNFWKDKSAMKACDVLIADTQAHAAYYSHTFNIDPKHIFVVPVGADTQDFKPSNHRDNDRAFRVGFYGGFIPLQGTEVILKAASLLKNEPDIEIELLGDGFEFDKMNELSSSLKLDNVSMPGWIEKEDLSSRLNQYDICLGIFGQSLKAQLVIPNKVFHYAAKAIPFISSDTPGMREVFSDEQNCLLINNRPEELAEAIIRLRDSEELRKTIGQAAYKLVSEEFNCVETAKRLLLAFEENIETV